MLMKFTVVFALIFALLLASKHSAFPFTNKIQSYRLSKQDSASFPSLKPFVARSSVLFANAEYHVNSEGSKVLENYFLLVIGVAIATSSFPYLLDNITNSNATAANRQIYIIALLLLKRIYLYFTSYLTLVISAERSASAFDVGKLGEVCEE